MERVFVPAASANAPAGVCAWKLHLPAGGLVDRECVFVKTRLDFAFMLLKEERNLCSGLLKSRLFLLLDYALKKKKKLKLDCVLAGV